MCATCGCEASAGGDHGQEHSHANEHGHDEHGHDEHGHAHEQGGAHADDHAGEQARARRLEIDLLAKNDRLARKNRSRLAELEVAAINLMSGPGAGKTTLLERTIAHFEDEVAVAVIEGDQETDRDGARIRATGAPAVQLNTGRGCHLDAAMIAAALDELALPPRSLLIIENVGNLVCPALFDLGESARVVVASVTEGEDKPLKYPHMFRAADVLLLNKIDLLPHTDFDVGLCLKNARLVNPNLRTFPISAATGEGLPGFCDWLRSALAGAHRDRGERSETDSRRGVEDGAPHRG